MVKIILLQQFGPVVIVALLTGCTINIYHAPEPGLVAVEGSTSVTGDNLDNSHVSASGISIKNTSFEGGASYIGHKSPVAELQLPPEKVLEMKAQSPDGDRTIYFMDKVALEVQLNVDAFVNCFYQQADGSILKIYPNRYSTGYWVYAGQRILLPDAQYFHIVADAMDKVEGFLCLASSEDVLAKLPKPYQLDTFETLPANDFDALFSLYRRSTHTNLVGRAVTYRIQ